MTDHETYEKPVELSINELAVFMNVGTIVNLCDNRWMSRSHFVMHCFDTVIIGATFPLFIIHSTCSLKSWLKLTHQMHLTMGKTTLIGMVLYKVLAAYEWMTIIWWLGIYEGRHLIQWNKCFSNYIPIDNHIILL